ncbi:APC family permease [Aeromicrobium yanjiei]|nr:APC family permease [Aeromicrobium yanjiei]
MTSHVAPPDRRSSPPPASGGEQLRGNMGTFELTFTALAFNAPLAVVAGFIPVIAGFENGLGSPLLFPAMGVLLLLFSVGLNAMAGRMEKPGAFYGYITRGLGRPLGLASAFFAVLVYVGLGAGTFTLLGVAAGDFADNVLGLENSGPWWAWALLGWSVVVALSLLNIGVSAKVLGIAMLFEVAIIAVWNARVLFDGGPDGRDVPVFDHVFDGSIALGLLFVAMCMTGFESLQVFREETDAPERTVPRATSWFLIILSVMYGITTLVYVIGQGRGDGLAAGAADPTGTVLESMQIYAGSLASDAASLFLITSAIACTLAVQNIAARYVYALGRDKVVPRVLGNVSQKHGSPVPASIFTGVAIAVVLMAPALGDADPVKSYAVLLGLAGYGIVLLWVLTSAAIVVFFRRHGDGQVTMWRGLVAPVLALIGLCVVAWLATTNLGDLVGDVRLAQLILAGAGLVALAGGVLALWWRRVDPQTYQVIGRQGE